MLGVEIHSLLVFIAGMGTWLLGEKRGWFTGHNSGYFIWSNSKPDFR